MPVTSTERSFLFRRGVMGQPGAEGAQGDLLGSGRPFYLAEEALPRAGVDAIAQIPASALDRRFHRRVAGPPGVVGRGPGWSGLAFDVVERNES